MKDHELRGIVLERFYARRGEGIVVLTKDDFDDDYSHSEIDRVCSQLEDKGLVKNWHRSSVGMGPNYGIGELTAAGSEVVEGVRESPFSLTFNDNKKINISSSENIQIGDNNTQHISTHVEQLLLSIESSSATPEQKEEAKSQLKKFLEHPAVVATIGSLVGAVFGSLS